MSPRRRESSISGMIREGIRARLLETHVCLPGVIEAFDPVTVRAEVRIPLKRVNEDLDGNRSTYDWPKLTEVPVVFPHAAGFAITMPVAVGDEVMLIFLDRDPSRWLEASKEQRPETLRAHDLSDAVVLVGMNTKASQIASYNATALEIRAPGTTNRIRIEADGSIDIQGADLKIGDGTDDLLALLEDLIDVINAILIDSIVNGAADGSLNSATSTAILAVKTKITNMKP